MSSWKDLKTLQPTAVRMLTNSVERDRLAHAYVFEGGRGTGKREVALLLAQTALCKNRKGADPCLVCSDCRRVESGNHPNVLRVVPDGASIKVDQIRALKKEFSMHGLEKSAKIYILEDAEKMTPGAANSLLKFLEEPNGDALAILITTAVQQLIRTILSRAQILSFVPLSKEKMVKKLLEEGIHEKEAVILSQLTNDLDECRQLSVENWIAQARNKVIQLMDNLAMRPSAAYMLLQEEWMPFFKEKEQLKISMDLMMVWYRDVIRMQAGLTDELIFYDQEDTLENQSFTLPAITLGGYLQAIIDAKRRLDANTAPQLVMEQLLYRLQEG